VTIGLGVYLGLALARPSPTPFLPGRTSDGHYQIESACDQCHTPLGGVQQAACNRCHGAALEESRDSHPLSKFTDPRNADRVAVLDARLCVTCHREHRPEVTGPMAVTLPQDFCFRCHEGIGRERESHRGLAFSTCASGGCHNFHDNRALYVDYLVSAADTPPLLAPARVPARTVASGAPVAHADAPAGHEDADTEADWSASAHARAGVGCTGCHAPPSAGGASATAARWIERPTHEVCGTCHEQQLAGFLAGKHGMRLSVGLSAMRPGWARLPMRPEAAERELGCGSCHDPHRQDTRRAAVEACEGCHTDEHTRAYRASPHFATWRREGEQPLALADTGVSCATCHLPRQVHGDVVTVEHNQNANLRPNEQMVRDVCRHCHGLQFSLDSLADAALVKSNFAQAPTTHLDSIRMASARKKLAPKEKAD
jgi:predicted CXXCH cytochrome family protein